MLSFSFNVYLWWNNFIQRTPPDSSKNLPQIYQTCEWQQITLLIENSSLNLGSPSSIIHTHRPIIEWCLWDELSCTSMEDILGFNSFSGALVVGNRCAGCWRGSAKRTAECQNDKISTKDYYCTGGKFNIMVTLVCTPIFICNVYL